MIKPISQFEPITKTLRFNLQQKSSNLKVLSGSSIHEQSLYISHPNDMVIPGGMDIKEKFYFNVTGKYPESVTERWVEVNENSIVNQGDQIVKIDKTIDGHTIGISKPHDALPEELNTPSESVNYDDLISADDLQSDIFDMFI